MRLRHPAGSVVHLAYCTNVHPAEDLAGIHEQLTGVAARVRALTGAGRLGLGLWLSRRAARALRDDPAELARLRARLDEQGLEVVTLNGFPYGGFHDEVVKLRVYRPDWAEPERLAYTLDLAEILTALLPDDVTEGSISTLPLAWRTGWTPAKAAAVNANLAVLARGLRALAERTGKTIRVGFEPEPGCIVETTPQAVALLGGADLDYLGVCLDACHLAVGLEEAADAAALGLPVVKLQVSSAVEAPPGGQQALAAYVEERYLHQTRCAAGYTDDLPEALAGELPTDLPWRTHFHMPLHAAPPAPLTTTSSYLEDLLRLLVTPASPHGDLAAPLTRHLEVETYTWSVLPGPVDIAEGIAAELDWTRRRLAALGLKEI
ncbi:TIM barrel protein [Microbispora cellulosiformans]|uniref:TIM barrel protein n=1 Tax=Microbispora cellulosiformans TaxID=2614688 RepID=A0A5J5K8A3_9ACTN|nr:metabolite traffic protein EboE [Microbispora cellulosiformans]KAA9380629.1 TIM barrel protein [Microbispora cellulosiformans]